MIVSIIIIVIYREVGTHKSTYLSDDAQPLRLQNSASGKGI